MTNLVYIYLQEPAEWDELRYSIRSVDKYFAEPYRIIIVGDKPDWLTGVGHIKCPPIRRRLNQKHIDQAWKIKSYLYQYGTGKSFVLLHDDVIFLRSVTCYDLRGPYAYSSREEWPDRKDFYLDLVRKTMSLFEGYVWSYETHMPMVYDPRKLDACMQQHNAVQEGLIIATLYFNTFNRYSPLDYRQCHVNFFGKDTAHSVSSDDSLWLRQKLVSKMTMSYNNAGLTPELKAFLQEKFPDPSKYEQ